MVDRLPEVERIWRKVEHKTSAYSICDLRTQC